MTNRRELSKKPNHLKKLVKLTTKLKTNVLRVGTSPSSNKPTSAERLKNQQPGNAWRPKTT